MHVGTLSSQLEPGLTLKSCLAMSPASAITQWRVYVERLTSVLVHAEVPTAPETTHASLRQARPVSLPARAHSDAYLLSFLHSSSGAFVDYNSSQRYTKREYAI